jgi:hypothetical protein
MSGEKREGLGMFTSDEVFEGEMSKNHCCNSDPKRSHSVNLGNVMDNF